MWHRLRLKAAIAVASLQAVLLLNVACATGGGDRDQALPPPPDCGVPAEGQFVVLLVSGTAHEPRPSLTSQAEQALQEAAEGDAEHGRNARGSVAVLASADAQPREAFPLTPRRDRCEVEYGFIQRDTLIDHNIERVREAVANRAAVRPGLDLLTGIDEAVRGYPPGVLVIVGHGLSTDGALDLRRVGWNEEPGHLVAQLSQLGWLQDLAPGWRVIFTGLGQTAGDAQPPLTKPTRGKLIGYWLAICEAAVAPGGSCEVDDSPLAPEPPLETAADMPVIDVPGIEWPSGPAEPITLYDEVLGFAPDSVVLSPEAHELLRGISDRIAQDLARQPDLTISIAGFVADPPDSTPAGRRQTSEARAEAVSEFIEAQLDTRGLSPRIEVTGAGTPPGMTATIDGMFDETTARQMRKVTINY